MLKKYILSILQPSVGEILKEIKTLKTELEREVKKELPFGMDFLTGEPIYRSNGYHVWMGKMFATEENFYRYREIVGSADESYKIYDGAPLETFSKKK